MGSYYQWFYNSCLFKARLHLGVKLEVKASGFKSTSAFCNSKPVQVSAPTHDLVKGQCKWYGLPGKTWFPAMNGLLPLIYHVRISSFADELCSLLCRGGGGILTWISGLLSSLFNFEDRGRSPRSEVGWGEEVGGKERRKKAWHISRNFLCYSTRIWSRFWLVDEQSYAVTDALIGRRVTVQLSPIRRVTVQLSPVIIFWLICCDS